MYGKHCIDAISIKSIGGQPTYYLRHLLIAIDPEAFLFRHTGQLDILRI